MAAKQLTHIEFFQACECARNHREEMVSICTSYRTAARFLTNKMNGPRVSNFAAQNVLDAVGIKLEKARANSNVKAKENVLILGRAIVALYNKLGEQAPEDLARLISEREHKKSANDKPAANGVPLRSIYVDPKTIPVVTPSTKPNERR